MPSGFRRVAVSLFAACVLFGSATFTLAKQDPTKPDEARLKPAYRFQRNHWVYVHRGSPADIGYQHGYLLAPEIAGGRLQTAQGRTENPQQESHAARNQSLSCASAFYALSCHSKFSFRLWLTLLPLSCETAKTLIVLIG